MASVLTFITLSSVLLFTSSVDARKDPAEYWKDVMKDQPILEAIQDVHSKPVSLSPLNNQKRKEYNSDSYLQSASILYHHGLDEHKVDKIPGKDSELKGLLHSKPVSLSPLENQKKEGYNSDSYLQSAGILYHHGLDEHKEDKISGKDSELKGLLHLKFISLSTLENQKQEGYNSNSYLQSAGILYHHGLDEHKEDTIPKKD